MRVPPDQDQFDSEALRPPNFAFEPDPRSALIFHELARQHAYVAEFPLNDTVPKAIRTHYDTARNLYVYAWFVFRFFPVAENYAFVTLEFALRERLGLSINGLELDPDAWKPSLAKLLKRAIADGLLKNEKFAARGRWAIERALNRYRAELSEATIRSLGQAIPYDESSVVPTSEDLNHDWLSGFIAAIPRLRNNYSHGSSTLRHPVLWTFDVVSEIINQLFYDSA